MIYEDQEDNEEVLKIYTRRSRRIILVKLDNDRHMPCSKDPRPLFYCGDEVSGLLLIEIIGGQPVKQVKVMLTSLIQIRFSSQFESKRRKSIFTDYLVNNDEKQIFFDRQKILEIDLINPEIQLTEGKHELPFRFRLPKAGLPSSMKSSNGLIKYTIEVFTIDENLNESRGEKEIIFLVPILDLRQIKRKTEKIFNIDDGDGGEITINATLDSKAFNPGDLLSMELSLINKSNQNVECQVFIYQRQIISNLMNNKRQIYETCLNNNNNNGEEQNQLLVLVGSNKNVENQKIQIRLPTNLVLSLECPLIMIKYYILITINNIPSDRMEIPFLLSLTNNNNSPIKN